ncbi:MAG: FMN-binding glutamate synthase family protein [Methyloprofundus sp.]|nr:FMN-binding glutamate synthase family protein [Methyloprofundus sp.]
MRKQFIVSVTLLVFLGIIATLIYPPAIWGFVLFAPFILLGIYDIRQKKHTLWRNFPVFGHTRWLMEDIRPMVQQYFVEPDLDGAPINRVFRSVVYQRSKKQVDTVPYGTKFNVYRVGYEWIGHSLAAKSLEDINLDLRVCIGGPDCKQPYQASIFNISAMSFGALSSHAVMALNGGAKRGNFAHNTGEGGISPYHLKYAGDLIWQIGTGYFGCRTASGGFDEKLFAEKALLPSVKMIEIKLSQGAKPGHGGVLPACKNTPEIALIRGIEPYTQVNSPAAHSAFSTPLELLEFIQQLRMLSAGKPIGFKLCIGQRSDFFALCKAMLKTGIKPDFITVDGGEGGTGAAPLEYSNSIGMPLLDALIFVSDCLIGFDLKKDIKIIASGKIFTGFHIIKRLSIGADLCNSARGMMLSMGCIQSLQCNTGHCPTGITTQLPALVKGLDVSDKRQRVANFHQETVKSVAEILAAAGLCRTEELNRKHVFRRISQTKISHYQEIYPPMITGDLLSEPFPPGFEEDLKQANAEMFDSTLCEIN